VYLPGSAATLFLDLHLCRHCQQNPIPFRGNLFGKTMSTMLFFVNNKPAYLTLGCFSDPGIFDGCPNPEIRWYFKAKDGK
jgi:hypothetical protein